MLWMDCFTVNSLARFTLRSFLFCCQAEEHLNRALQINKHDKTFMMLGKVHLQAGDTDKAIDVYKRAVEWVRFNGTVLKSIFNLKTVAPSSLSSVCSWSLWCFSLFWRQKSPFFSSNFTCVNWNLRIITALVRHFLRRRSPELKTVSEMCRFCGDWLI